MIQTHHFLWAFFGCSGTNSAIGVLTIFTVYMNINSHNDLNSHFNNFYEQRTVRLSLQQRNHAGSVTVAQTGLKLQHKIIFVLK